MSAGLPRLARLLAPQRGRVALAVALGVATVAAGVGLMGTSAWLISKAALHPSIAALGVAIVGVRFFGIVRALARYSERLAAHDVTLRVLARLRVDAYRVLEPLAPARLAAQRSGDLLARLVADVETLEGAFVRVLGPSLVALASLAALALGLADLGAAIVAAVAAPFLIAIVIAPWLLARLGRAAGERLVERRAALDAALVDVVQGIADLLVFGGAAAQRARIEGLSAACEQARGAGSQLAALGAALGGLLADAAVLLALIVAIPAVSAGQLDGALLAVVALVALAAFEAAAPLAAAWAGLGASAAAARRVFALGEATPAVAGPAAPAPLPPAAAAVELRGLSFRYPGAAAEALHGIDLRLEPGRLVAVVGPSGAGKSTLAALLLRFWEVPPGSYRIGGRDVRELDPDAVRRRFGWVAQSTHLFVGTLGDNLRLARPDASEAELAAAARGARLDDCVARLPDGFDTWVGEQGLTLSGGERQRVAIARALLQDRPLLILDEPTTHLDALVERALLEDLHGLAAGRGTLLISHRLVGLERADEILVLQAGRVVERGRFATLAGAGGHFSRLLEAGRRARVLEDLWRAG